MRGKTERTWVIPVSWVQNAESKGLQVGLTKLLNSSTTSSLLAMPFCLSFHMRRHTGHSCILKVRHNETKIGEERVRTYDDFVRPMKVGALHARRLDIKNKKSIVRLSTKCRRELCRDSNSSSGRVDRRLYRVLWWLGLYLWLLLR